MSDTYDISDIHDVYENAISGGQRMAREQIIKALEEELEHATVRRSKDDRDEAYDAGYRSAIEEAIQITREAKAES